MKSPVLLLAASVLVNVALITTFVVKPELAPVTVRGYFQSSAAQKAEKATAAEIAKRAADAHEKANAARAASSRSRLWSALDSDDLPTLVAHLRAAGFSAVVIRGIVSARIDRSFASRTKALMGEQEARPFWKPDGTGYGGNQKL